MLPLIVTVALVSVIPGAGDALWRKLLLAAAAALMGWLTWYVNMLGRERKEKEAVQRALTETEQKLDRAEQRADRAEQRADEALVLTAANDQ